MQRRTISGALVAASLSPFLTTRTLAYPAAQTRVLVPSSAGGFGDRIARLLSDRWASSGHGRLIVGNRPGAGGALALRQFATAPGDGSALFLGSTGTAIVLPMTKAGNNLKNLTPVMQIASVPGVLLASAQLPREFASLVDYIRSRPGHMSFGSAGNGSLGHLAFEALSKAWGAEIRHVSYKSGPEAMPDLLAGRLHLGILNLGDATWLAASGRVNAVAVSGPTRSQMLPMIPTFEEAGIGEADIEHWQGLFLPPNSSPQLVQKVVEHVVGLRSSSDFARKLGTLSATPSLQTSEQFAEKLLVQSERVARLVVHRRIDLA
ncbi:MAG: hypothetical protein DI587_37485 [Variovorax paradoxus]|nr:MAG: hypothetical protein DI583_37485 [Variovorax paradoxus]PZQ00109.1 MAG: hypothetical protein DI587_37485 [Variovorax paradoxus]